MEMRKVSRARVHLLIVSLNAHYHSFWQQICVDHVLVCLYFDRAHLIGQFAVRIDERFSFVKAGNFC